MHAEINMMEGRSFWPTTQRVKEGRSLKNESVNDSNVTEGAPSLPPVESKDTAYQPKSKVMARYTMRAPRSARNKIKEGGSVNDSNVTEGVLSLPPVESKDTPCVRPAVPGTTLRREAAFLKYSTFLKEYQWRRKMTIF
jgi:hypothetical protein